MKKLIYTLIATLFATMMTLSCSKDSTTPGPIPVPGPDVPGKAFTVLVSDTWTGYNKDSVYTYCGTVSADCFNGVTFTEGYTATGLTFKNTPDVVELILTPYNRIAFETTSPVTALSSDDAISVSSNDSVHFTVGSYVRDCEASVTFASGSGSLARTITIKVLARESVEVKGFEMAISDRNGGNKKTFMLVPQPADVDFKKSREIPELLIATMPDIRYTNSVAVEKINAKIEELKFKGRAEEFLIQYPNEFIECYRDVSKAYILEFVGTVPRNATPDNNVVQMIDLISTRQHSIQDAYNYYKYNTDKFEGFRWAPNKNNFIDDAGYYRKGGAKQNLNPCDLRYLKALYWGQNTGDTYPFDYVWYQSGNNESPDNWWANTKWEHDPSKD